jgi:hypothetical protein
LVILVTFVFTGGTARAQQADSSPPAPVLAEAQQALNEGRHDYLNFDFATAVQKLGQAANTFEKGLAQYGDFDSFAKAIGFLGASYLGLHDDAAAESTFRRLLHRRPDYQLDRSVFPPQVIAVFRRTRNAVRNSMQARLSIDTVPPGAQVTFDGERRGTTPLTLSEVLAGTHALRLDLPAYRPSWESFRTAGGDYRLMRKLTSLSEPTPPVDAPLSLEAPVPAPRDVPKQGAPAGVWWLTGIGGGLVASGLIFGGLSLSLAAQDHTSQPNGPLGPTLHSLTYSQARQVNQEATISVILLGTGTALLVGAVTWALWPSSSHSSDSGTFQF